MPVLDELERFRRRPLVEGQARVPLREIVRIGGDERSQQEQGDQKHRQCVMGEQKECALLNENKERRGPCARKLVRSKENIPFAAVVSDYYAFE